MFGKKNVALAPEMAGKLLFSYSTYRLPVMAGESPSPSNRNGERAQHSPSSRAPFVNGRESSSYLRPK